MLNPLVFNIFLIHNFPAVFAKIGYYYHRQPQYQGEEHVQGYQTGQVTKADFNHTLGLKENKQKVFY